MVKGVKTPGGSDPEDTSRRMLRWGDEFEAKRFTSVTLQLDGGLSAGSGVGGPVVGMRSDGLDEEA